jgi:hypothetical protein
MFGLGVGDCCAGVIAVLQSLDVDCDICITWKLAFVDTLSVD